MSTVVSVSQLSLNFNLREPRGNKCTNVYAVVKYGKVQLKFSIGCKVNCWQWDKKKQSPIITDKMSDKDVKNNMKVINIISSVKFGYLNFFSYICTNSLSATKDELKERMNNIIKETTKEYMANNQNLKKSVVRTPKASTLIKEAFGIYYTEKAPSTKESSKRIEIVKLNSFYNYCKEVGKDKMSMLTTKGLNDYKNHLVMASKTKGEKGESNKSINNKCRTLAKLINEVLIKHNRFLKYKLKEVNYTPLEEVNAKGEEKMRRPITEEEMKRLMECDKLDEKDKEYRDLFVLECNGSYRISDTPKLFDKTQQTHSKVGDYEFIVINTKKENTTSVIWVNDVVRRILTKYESGFKYVKFDNEKAYQRNFNRHLRKIFKLAGLDSMETFIDSKGIERKKNLYEIVGSHFARYTFIYNGLFVMGIPPSDLKAFTGHVDEKMIEDVYTVFTKDDKVRKAARALERAFGNKEKDTRWKIQSELTPRANVSLTPENFLFLTP